MDPKRAVISISGFGNAIFILFPEQGFAELLIAGVGAPGREGLMSLRVCVGGGGAWPSTHTAGARPILLFARSNTVRYSLRKTSPSTHISGSEESSRSSSKLLEQMCE